jgi:hypothetical protein
MRTFGALETSCFVWCHDGYATALSYRENLLASVEAGTFDTPWPVVNVDMTAMTDASDQLKIAISETASQPTMPRANHDLTQ